MLGHIQNKGKSGLLVRVPLFCNSLRVICVPAYNLFRTMWPDPAMGLFCNTNIVQEITNLTVNPPGLWLAFEQRSTWFQVTDVDFSIMRPWEEQLKRFEKLYSHVLCVVRAHARSKWRKPVDKTLATYINLSYTDGWLHDRAGCSKSDNVIGYQNKQILGGIPRKIGLGCAARLNPYPIYEQKL